MKPNDWNKHAIVGSCIRLPLILDPDILLREINDIPDELWGEERANVHSNVDAVFVKGYPPIQRKPDEDRPVLKQLPYIKKIIFEMIPGLPGKCVIANLRPASEVLLHRDGHVDNPQLDDTYFYDYFRSTLRIHIPVKTNDKVWFFCKNDFYHMPAGEVWTINNLSDHAVINDHPTESRIHIIVDIHPNEETFKWIQMGKIAQGWHDKIALKRLMARSHSPAISPYARGKPVPE